MTKKIPQRQCVGCRQMKPKKELIRVIRTRDEEVMIDGSGKMNGRGAYLCRDEACFKKIRKSGSLAKALKISIPEEVYDHLAKEMMEFDKE